MNYTFLIDKAVYKVLPQRLLRFTVPLQMKRHGWEVVMRFEILYNKQCIYYI